VEILVLSAADVERLLPMAECIEVISEALARLARGEAFVPLRSIVQPPGLGGLLALMPGYVSGGEPAFGYKAVAVFPGNAQIGVDTHQGAVALLDPETGRLVALMEGSAITAIRTAAASAVSARHLSREDAAELAIIGAGVQARTHLEAISRVRGIGRVRIWNRTRERADGFVTEQSSRYGFPISVAESAEAAVHGADVVVTATHAIDPVIKA
jgi:ornithine cyclodeaminase/alanine dehydrogenase-like protein (mu-crystallin family)